MLLCVIKTVILFYSVVKDGHKNFVCVTVPETELQIVSLLQEKFLELLARFR